MYFFLTFASPGKIAPGRMACAVCRWLLYTPLLQMEHFAGWRKSVGKKNIGPCSLKDRI